MPVVDNHVGSYRREIVVPATWKGKDIIAHFGSVTSNTVSYTHLDVYKRQVRKVFPAAKLINDRFHVQQLMSEAVDQLRIRYRWKVLDAENQAIREHRQKKKGRLKIRRCKIRRF